MLTKMDRALRLKKIKSTLLKTEFLSLSITDVVVSEIGKVGI